MWCGLCPRPFPRSTARGWQAHGFKLTPVPGLLMTTDLLPEVTVDLISLSQETPGAHGAGHGWQIRDKGLSWLPVK